MKKLFGMLIVGLLSVSTFGVYALSFGPDTMFLEADTAKECQNLGGTYTQWYDETYCTTVPSELLTNEEQKNIEIVAQKIVELIEMDNGLYAELIDLLDRYKVKFMEKKDIKRLAIAILLEKNIEGTISIVPETCSVRFDGCNTCQVMENGELACTKMACFRHEEPMCKVHEKRIDIADHTVECTGVGPQTCLLMSEEGQNDWTYFYNNIEGFEYIEGYQWTLLVEETHLDPANVPADGSSISWKLKKVINISAEVPESCTTWFDGCNTCSVGENEIMACTLMYCEEVALPYCLDDK